MSYANGTQFYNLPQTVGTDKRDWFDTNAAFAALDAALHAAATGQAADAEAISTINASLAADEANIAALQTASTTQAASIATLQTAVTNQATQIADVRQDAEDMITANNEGAAATSTRAYNIGDRFIYNDVLYKATAAIAIGDTIVPNTNCEATNVDTELTQLNNDLDNKADSTDLPNIFNHASQRFPLVYLTDCDIITPGTNDFYMYAIDGNTANSPSSTSFALLIEYSYNTGYAVQYALTNGGVRYRVYGGGTWTAWS